MEINSLLTKLFIQTLNNLIVLCTGIRPSYEYSNGNRTNTINGYQYHIIFPDLGYDDLWITVTETEPKITPEILMELQGSVPVKIHGLMLRAYSRTNEYAVRLSAKADSIEIAKEDK